MSETVTPIGKCSVCGGVVVQRNHRNDPEIFCEDCGAKKKRSLPIIEMENPIRWSQGDF